MTVTWLGTVTVITPAHIHITLSPMFNFGATPTITFGVVGIHGETIKGIHGIGTRVKTPRAAAVAAAVAAATVGLANDEHTPNGATFTIGAKSIIFPIGNAQAMVLLTGSTFNGDGATPNEHRHMHVLQALIGIIKH